MRALHRNTAVSHSFLPPFAFLLPSRSSFRPSFFLPSSLLARKVGESKASRRRLRWDGDGDIGPQGRDERSRRRGQEKEFVRFAARSERVSESVPSLRLLASPACPDSSKVLPFYLLSYSFPFFSSLSLSLCLSALSLCLSVCLPSFGSSPPRLCTYLRRRLLATESRDRHRHEREDAQQMFKWTHRPLPPKCRGMTS